LTKMEAATKSDLSRAALTSDKCPSCKAPMVGTSPRCAPRERAVRPRAFISEMLRTSFIKLLADYDQARFDGTTEGPA